ncbi:MAG: Rhodanese Homology Domain fused to beta-lactamase superfamily hydrolase [Candidatus Methanohalarchaeum thermophilum]|uniref:Rhodanese Homology Domain fused to beta-lactamase superfamily hydrolase n=1 Tax=Methanohalarchaeum thermophilum TaxID=1903181 RepID=A0A1Q6DU16_METT1|nr:MAG: Rhodanese Homology Domain fused to beta-lactamase superfamily hydrolase [Candidatus Methanohalarchaeum thermophilum]
MLFERIESEGLAHYSYIIGDGTEAAVIDPRRDVEVYLKKAREQEMDIKYVLETHRNEDYVVGSREIKNRTECEIWHADRQLEYEYGKPVEEGVEFEIGDLSIEAIHTPGHTPGSMSYLLKEYSGENWALFSGDALFAGDVGRVDLLGMDKAEENAEALYDSIFNKILKLGDEVLLFPAHGPGSVCAESIANRKWTTIGIEKKRNPKLRYDTKKEFVNEIKEKLERPPYFRKMEELNLKPPLLGDIPWPNPMSPAEFQKQAQDNWVLDTRTELSYGAAHTPHSISIWKDGVPSFVGWFLDYQKPISLVTESPQELEKVTKYLIRLGYDEIEGYLSGGMVKWHMSGKNSHSIEMLTVQDLCEKIDKEKELDILDVRGKEEIKENGRIEGAEEIHLTKIKQNISKIKELDDIHIFCGSGLRSMIAASILRNKGIKNLKVVLGGLSGWKSNKCHIK